MIYFLKVLQQSEDSLSSPPNLDQPCPCVYSIIASNRLFLVSFFGPFLQAALLEHFVVLGEKSLAFKANEIGNQVHFG